MSDLDEGIRAVVAKFRKDETAFHREGTDLWNAACVAPEGQERDSLMDLSFKAFFLEVVARHMREGVIKSAFDSSVVA